MKPKPSTLCLLLSASALGVMSMPAEEKELTSQEATKIVTETVKAEPTTICYQLVHQQVLVHLNPQSSILNRFSRVMRPAPMQYYDVVVNPEMKDEIVHYEITFFDRRVMGKKSPKLVVAKGTYNSKSNQLFLFDEETEKMVPVAEHRLVTTPRPFDGATYPEIVVPGSIAPVPSAKL